MFKQAANMKIFFNIILFLIAGFNKDLFDTQQLYFFIPVFQPCFYDCAAIFGVRPNLPVRYFKDFYRKN
jgi:hypothetical protein